MNTKRTTARRTQGHPRPQHTAVRPVSAPPRDKDVKVIRITAKDTSIVYK